MRTVVDGLFQGPVGELLEKLGRHNMRPNHLHMMFKAPGYKTLTTALYPEGDVYLNSDAVFGVKKSLVVVRIGFYSQYHNNHSDRFSTEIITGHFG